MMFRVTLFLLCFHHLGISAAVDPLNSAVGLVVEREDSKTICSGVIIAPKLLLTAGHCLRNTKKVRLILKDEISTSDFLGKSGDQHAFAAEQFHILDDRVVPPKDLNSFRDLGLIEMSKEISGIQYPKLIAKDKSFSPGLEFTRVGFGKRFEKNKRSEGKSQFDSQLNKNFKTKDNFGVGGDSGGPLFLQEGGRLYLASIHLGRFRNQKNQFEDFSYSVDLRSSEVLKWIQSFKLKK